MTVNLSFFGLTAMWNPGWTYQIMVYYLYIQHMIMFIYYVFILEIYIECTHPSITPLFLLLQNPLSSSYKKGIAAGRNS